MNLWPVEPFCPHFFFQISADLEKKWGEKGLTGQSNFLQNPYFRG